MPPLLAVRAALVPPAARVRMFQLDVPEPLVVRAYPLVPPVVGNVKVQVPAVAAGWIVTLPEVFPANLITPSVAPAVPRSSKAPGAVVPIPTLPPAKMAA